MPELRDELVESLAKVLIAAAWVDNELTPQEIGCLKDVLYRYYGAFRSEHDAGAAQSEDMAKSDNWAQFDMYLEHPIAAEERARLVAELSRDIQSKEEKDLAFSILEQVVEADGKVTASERQAIDDIKTIIDEAGENLFKKAGVIINGALSRRSETLAQAPNREQFLEEYLSNRVYYEVRLRMGVDNSALRIDDIALRKLSAAGGLMARVAKIDRELTEEEIETMKMALEIHWDINHYEAAFVAETALTEVTADLDYTRLTREFVTFTTVAERARFLDVLFTVAAADGLVSPEEVNEIHEIAANLFLSSHSVEEAKKRFGEL